MKRIEPEQIGDLMRMMIQESGMAGRLDECRAVELWRHVIGERIARLTSRPKVSCGVMIIYVSSAPLRHELTMNATGIINALNGAIGKEVIKSIRFM
ncbi:MAG: DUF721 domain-containing protein [Muribaculaceae bacterium]|nr:DUF721 domain-containing protein [Muribaculaceae bacterium]MDE6866138.1 DUF721 domain-containing protein [Muribaculaceae bacterium]